WYRSVEGVNEGVFGWVSGIYDNEMASVGAVVGRALEALIAPWATDQHWLALGEVMKPFKGVDTTQGDPLHRVAGRARVGHLGEQPGEPFHPVSQTGWLGRSG